MAHIFVPETMLSTFLTSSQFLFEPMRKVLLISHLKMKMVKLRLGHVSKAIDPKLYSVGLVELAWLLA